jgi:hypothetical protein
MHRYQYVNGVMPMVLFMTVDGRSHQKKKKERDFKNTFKTKHSTMSRNNSKDIPGQYI